MLNKAALSANSIFLFKKTHSTMNVQNAVRRATCTIINNLASLCGYVDGDDVYVKKEDVPVLYCSLEELILKDINWDDVYADLYATPHSFKKVCQSLKKRCTASSTSTHPMFGGKWDFATSKNVATMSNSNRTVYCNRLHT
jgi:hypothetical protein